MSIALFIAAGIVSLDVLYTVSRTGKPREPISGGLAVTAVIQYGGVVALLVWAGVQL
jgi:hypothetical protein